MALTTSKRIQGGCKGVLWFGQRSLEMPAPPSVIKNQLACNLMMFCFASLISSREASFVFSPKASRFASARHCQIKHRAMLALMQVTFYRENHYPESLPWQLLCYSSHREILVTPRFPWTSRMWMGAYLNQVTLLVMSEMPLSKTTAATNLSLQTSYLLPSSPILASFLLFSLDLLPAQHKPVTAYGLLSPEPF